MQANKCAQDLARLIMGRVLTKADPEYPMVVRIDNGRIRLEPPIAILASSVDDIVKTVDYARRNSIRITVRGGGHSAAGYCLNDDGIVLDLRGMDDIRFDSKTQRLRVGMGARWKQ